MQCPACLAEVYHYGIQELHTNYPKGCWCDFCEAKISETSHCQRCELDICKECIPKKGSELFEMQPLLMSKLLTVSPFLFSNCRLLFV